MRPPVASASRRIQLAKAAGAEVHGTASPGKHARLAELGVDRAIDYRRDGWWKGLPPYDVCWTRSAASR